MTAVQQSISNMQTQNRKDLEAMLQQFNDNQNQVFKNQNENFQKYVQQVEQTVQHFNTQQKTYVDTAVTKWRNDLEQKMKHITTSSNVQAEIAPMLKPMEENLTKNTDDLQKERTQVENRANSRLAKLEAGQNNGASGKSAEDIDSKFKAREIKLQQDHNQREAIHKAREDGLKTRETALMAKFTEANKLAEEANKLLKDTPAAAATAHGHGHAPGHTALPEELRQRLDDRDLDQLREMSKTVLTYGWTGTMDERQKIMEKYHTEHGLPVTNMPKMIATYFGTKHAKRGNLSGCVKLQYDSTEIRRPFCAALKKKATETPTGAGGKTKKITWRLEVPQDLERKKHQFRCHAQGTQQHWIQRSCARLD